MDSIQVQKSNDFNSIPLQKQHFQDNKMYDLLTFKDMYLYEYFNSTSTLCEKKLPSIEEFYVSLHDRQCTTADYKFAKQVWAKGGCKNGEEYCKMYLASDT